MTKTARMILGAALLATACRRPAPETTPQEWSTNPGLDAHPAGRTLQGPVGPALPRASFRLDPDRGLATAGKEEPIAPEESLYRGAAQSGQAWAQAKLGAMYVQRGPEARRFGEGLRWLNAAAEQNDIEALRMLSVLAAEGRGMEQSDKEAYKYMRRAADLGSPEAQYALANMLANGRGMPRDMEAAIVWGSKAAEQGYAPAQLAVARALISAVEQERKNKAVDLLTKAAQAGQVEAVLFLATAVGKGDYGLPKDEARAEALLLPWAEKGNADCQFVLAALYKFGDSFTDRREEAYVWMQRAAAQGHAQAIGILESERPK